MTTEAVMVEVIDPVQYGKLLGTVEALMRETQGMRERQGLIDAKMDKVLSELDQVKGGWRVAAWIMMSVSAAIGAVAHYIVGRFQ